MGHARHQWGNNASPAWRMEGFVPHLHIKGWLLQRIDEVGDNGLWDW